MKGRLALGLGMASALAVAQTAQSARGNLYVGRFVPRRPGRWTIRVANFGPSYPPCTGSVIRFTGSK